MTNPNPELPKLYIAGKWTDKVEIGKIIDHVGQLGYTVTHDWTKVEFATREPKALAKMAELDINGVKQADVLLVLMTDPEYAYRGTFTEIGCALGLDKKIVIVAPSCTDLDKPITTTMPFFKTNCFYHHPNIVHLETWKDAIRYLDLEY